jgi:acetylornithine deacetylase/succinyl-diaminopimelate desuccinylase-like protein
MWFPSPLVLEQLVVRAIVVYALVLLLLRFTGKRQIGQLAPFDLVLLLMLSNAVQEITGRKPDLSTTGGTSDARFIKDYCPVIEFGLTGETMHKIDENVATADIEKLSRVYERVLERFFA